MANFRYPAEWEKHQACWLAWPSHKELWLESLEEAQAEFTGLCQAMGENLEILVPDETAKADAQRALKGLSVRFHLIPFGDIWLRDTAPIFLTDSEGALATARFSFNGWGGKYVLPYDDQVSTRIARAAEFKEFKFPWILEGGSVEVDGEGTCLTTRQCLLNDNRNKGMTEAQVEAGLRDALGVKTVLWLQDGLLNDHTDGHIDTLARFTAPGTVVCMKPNSQNDPNREVLEEIARDLAGFQDASGRRLKVVTVPSPGKVLGKDLNDDDRIMPASYLNFYIANQSVVVPIYGSPHDNEAVAAIAELFPGRKTVGLPAKAILTGGGAFHCITQQQPFGAIRNK